MRAPKEMEVIQIEITNACVRVCSNCTRFCGHHKKPYFMDFETFKRAVDSLSGYTGVVGIMGGEPTIHPLFEQFTLYLKSKFQARGNLNAARKPLSDFLTYTRAKHNANRVLNKCAGPGLWTSITNKYNEHYELIQDTFTFQSLNDHSKTSYHHPLLVSRKDLGIDDTKWLKLRDKCWIQNCWSASITPKGAFFCEVAASLDMLFNGSGGWPIENGWWNITPEQFGEQLKWCELCGGALTTYRRDANEGITDVTPSLLNKLKEIESPLINKDKIHVFDANNFEAIREYMDFNSNQYIDDFSNRLSDSAKYLKGLSIETLSIDKNDFGFSLYNSITSSPYNWFMYCEEENDEIKSILTKIKEYYLNNGSIYRLEEGSWLFSKKSLALRNYGHDRILKARSIEDIILAYPQDKIINVDINENELTADELLWRKHIDNDFLNIDKTFRNIFESTILSKAKKGGNILITQSASYFLTRGLITLLKDIGMNPFLITHRRFSDKFTDILKDNYMLTFSNNIRFDYEDMISVLDTSDISDIRFDGAIIPYSVPRSVIVAEDGYQDIEKIVNHITDVIARINIKREFVTIDFDINGEIYHNQWDY